MDIIFIAIGAAAAFAAGTYIVHKRHAAKAAAKKTATTSTATTPTGSTTTAGAA